jgi:hypothetical protein
VTTSSETTSTEPTAADADEGSAVAAAPGHPDSVAAGSGSDVPEAAAEGAAADVPPTPHHDTDGSATPDPDAATASPAIPSPTEAGSPAAPATSPRPQPRPAPVPHRPGPIPRQSTDSEAAPAADAARWGRVDDEGNVWVRTAEGESQVGSYPGATPDEALAFFARKYDELAGQVRLLQQRVRTTELPAKEAQSTLERLRASVAEGHAVGDLGALTAALDEVAAAVEKRRVEADAARARVRAEARVTKERIVGEAETLADSSSWKASGDRLRSLVEEWKAAPRLDRKGDDELWKRFSAARSTFDKRRRTHFAALDGQREESKARKERLVREAEALQDSKEWGPTAQRYRDLLAEWKASGRAGKGEEEALWQRFRAAQDAFFSARSAVFEERDAALKDNLATRECLAAAAEALLPVTDLRAAKNALRSLQERWEAAGHVPRADRDRMDNRLRKVEQVVRDAEQQQWQRSNPESRARAESATSQLRASIAQLEATAAKARAAGRDKEADEAESALAARRAWLAEAEKYVQ